MKPELFWFRFEPRRFSQETQHLSPAELGHHLRLIILAWERPSCAIPADVGWITRRLGLTPDAYRDEVAPLLSDLWHREGSDWVNDWLRQQRFDAVERSDKAQRAALARHHGEKVTPLKTRDKM